MKTLNADVNTSRMAGNNGGDFVENGTLTGVWYGFMPHKDGCKITAVTLTYGDGTDVEGFIPTWVNTTLDLDAFIPAGVYAHKKIYITSLTVTGGATCYTDTLATQ